MEHSTKYVFVAQFMAFAFAHSAHAEPIEVVSVRAGVPGSPTVSISVRFAADLAVSPDSLEVSSSTTTASGTRMRQDEWRSSRLLTFEVPDDTTISLFVLQLLWGEGPFGREGTQLFFERRADELYPIDYLDAIGRLHALEPLPPLAPSYPAEFTSLSPLDNPLLLEADREYARAQLDSNRNSKAGALLGSPPAPDDGGCAGGPFGASALMCILFLAKMLPRVRLRLLLPLLTLGFGGAAIPSGQVKARTIYGFVVFWDARVAPGSDALGSVLPWCDITDGDCMAIDPDCCFRGLDSYTISIRQTGGPILATTVATSSGFYVLTFNGNDSLDYYLTVRFERPTGVGPGALNLNNLSVPKVQDASQKLTLPMSSSDYWVPDFRLNAAFNTTSITGGFASAWQSVSEVQRGISHEGDTRYRRYFGAPATGPDDVVVIDIGSGWNGASCGWLSMIGLTSVRMRQADPGVYMGQIYRSRVVGCNPTAYFNGVTTVQGPAFPPAPILQTDNTYTGEGIALGIGIDWAVWMRARWDPALATQQALDLFGHYGCVPNFPGNENGNDAAYFDNNGRAVWEWLDKSTVQNSGVDNSEITLKQLMDGLLHLKNTPGTLDGQGGEASFTPTPSNCTTNHSCVPGEVCAVQIGPTTFCAGGDPNGSNIRDLATALNDLATPGRGNLLTSAGASSCMGGPDNSFRFEGGYRSD